MQSAYDGMQYMLHTVVCSLHAFLVGPQQFDDSTRRVIIVPLLSVFSRLHLLIFGLFLEFLRGPSRTTWISML